MRKSRRIFAAAGVAPCSSRPATLGVVKIFYEDAGCLLIETAGRHARARSRIRGAMQRVGEAALQELRLRYRAADSAYRACARAVTEASMSGNGPSPAQLEQEAKARADLTKVRTDLMAAMAKSGSDKGPPNRERC